ncbi:MAG: hypothetical protein GY906_31460 [bacterium]|nr:hypothetical protein [bacterium]
MTNTKRLISSSVIGLALFCVTAAPLFCADWPTVWAAFKDDNCETVLRDAPSVISEHGDYAPAHYVLGVCQLRTEQNTDGTENLRKAINLDETILQYIQPLAQKLMAEGKNEEAYVLLSAVDRTAMATEQRTSITMRLASAALGCDKFDEAISTIRLLLVDDEESVQLHRVLAGAYLKNGAKASAAAELERVWELDPEETTSARDAIDLFMRLAHESTLEASQLKYGKQAYELAQRLANATPEHQNLFLAGETAREIKDLEGAAKWFQKAHTSKPDHALSAYYLSQTLAEQGQDDGAFKGFSAALKVSEDAELSQRIHHRLAKIHACRLELDKAAEHYDSAGRSKKASEIRQIADSSRDALAELKKLRSNLKEINAMKKTLQQVGEEKGVTALEQQAATMEAQIRSIEANLAEVRNALCK